MVHLEFYDGSGQASCEELNEYMRQKKEILTRVQAGPEKSGLLRSRLSQKGSGTMGISSW